MSEALLREYVAHRLRGDALDEAGFAAGMQAGRAMADVLTGDIKQLKVVGSVFLDALFGRGTYRTVMSKLKYGEGSPEHDSAVRQKYLEWKRPRQKVLGEKEKKLKHLQALEAVGEDNKEEQAELKAEITQITAELEVKEGTIKGFLGSGKALMQNLIGRLNVDIQRITNDGTPLRKAFEQHKGSLRVEADGSLGALNALLNDPKETSTADFFIALKDAYGIKELEIHKAGDPSHGKKYSPEVLYLQDKLRQTVEDKKQALVKSG